MSQPDVFVVDELVTLVDTEWNIDDTRLIIAKSDDIGKGRDLATYDYIEFSATSPTAIDYSDIFMSTQDVDVVNFVELKSSTETRRNAMFSEFRRIIEAHRKRPDTPGDYDRMLFEDVTPMDDETFGAYLHEVVIGFEARSRGVQE